MFVGDPNVALFKQRMDERDRTIITSKEHTRYWGGGRSSGALFVGHRAVPAAGECRLLHFSRCGCFALSKKLANCVRVV